MIDSLRPHELQSTRLLCPWDSPGKNTWMSCHSLLQGIFLTQVSNPGLLCCRQTLYRLSYEGTSPTSLDLTQMHFFFIAEWHSIMYMHHNFFICLSVYGHLGVLLPEKSQGQRSLVSYSPWGHRGEHDSVTKQQEQQPFLPYRPETTEGTRINRASPPHCQTDSFLSPCPLIYEMYIMSMLLSYISIIGIFLLVLVVVLLVTKSCSTLATSWTVACQAPLSMGFFRQEYWSGMLFPSPGESSWPKNWTQVSWIAGRFFTDWAMREAFLLVFCLIISSFYPSFLLFCDLRIQNSLDFTKDNVGMPIFHSYCLKVLRVKGRSRNFETLPTNLKSS